MSKMSWMLGLALLLAPAIAGADRTPNLRYTPWIEGPATAVGMGLIVANGIFESHIAPSTCSWCDRDAAGNDTLNGFDAELRGLRLQNPALVRKWGDIAIWRILPQFPLALLLLANVDNRNDGIVDSLIMLETIVITALGTQIFRYTTARERPYVHFMSPEERARTDLSVDVNSSFFSGHASVSFAMAVAAGTIASMRHSRWAPAIWIVGLALSSLAAYSRIAADLHYPLDVFTGVVFGSLVGFSVPYFLHSPTD